MSIIKSKAALALVALGVLIPAGAQAGSTDNRATVPAGSGSRAIIYGCPAEDSCAINYHGNGTWTIRRDRH